ncbi:MAG: hypothetical protein INR73_23455 [Williamsia sp.]|nr:hypothetical protein [Williamsia sp.]
MNYFLHTIQHLRQQEEVLLFNNLLEVTVQQREEAAQYLAEAYQHESINYPFQVPVFDQAAALWAAQTVYTASQLVLYRKHGITELAQLLPAYSKAPGAAAMLSADLLLRFLPSLINQLKVYDPEDGLVEVLENHLKAWHYSGVNYSLPVHELSFDVVVSHPCLYQLYIDRVIEYRRLPLAEHPQLISGVRASLGMFAAVYWNEFQQVIQKDECN